ncbi:MAG: hypothetical protein JST82_14365 [Bacteroidetes bacterium]|nr:hypothetical protein [Bacteroidota bacterium]
MQKASLYIYFLAASVGCISILYFLSLVAQLPFIASVVMILLAEFGLVKWFYRIKTAQAEKANTLQYGILIFGLILLISNIAETAQKHGAWDAWAIWNLHAKYLADAAHWKNMFLNTVSAHADYPLALPSTLAFLNNIFPNALLTNYSFHILILLSIPVIIYLQTCQRSLLLSGIAFLLLCKDDFFATIGNYQMADTLLAFFLLLAIIAIDHVEEDKKYIILSTAMIGCCIWAKNEGAVLAILYTAFYYKELLSKGTYKYSLIGIAIPLIAYGIFKLGFAPGNDIVNTQGADTLNKLTDWQRYKTIYNYWNDNIHAHYYTITCTIMLCVLLGLIKSKIPDKKIMFILSVCIAYSMVYLISPHDLDWHLKTSLYRLIHQLMPSAIYISVIYLAGSNPINFRARFATNQQRPL